MLDTLPSRNLLNIADPRSQPADVVDAALAVGTTAFAMPREQEAMAKAHRGAIACATAMKQLLWADVLAVEVHFQNAPVQRRIQEGHVVAALQLLI